MKTPCAWFVVAALVGCGGSGGGVDGGPGGNGGSNDGGVDCDAPVQSGSVSGVLMDQDAWQATDEGVELFGEPPQNNFCEPPDDYRAESLGGEYVFSILTTSLTCNHLTVTQPSRFHIKAGDSVRVRFFHGALTAPIDATANAAVAICGELMWSDSFRIPSSSELVDITWMAPRDYPQGAPLLYHVDNHGNNEYALITLTLN